jgi:glycine/D-amino acid oxidase-like deaminating enzyme
LLDDDCVLIGGEATLFADREVTKEDIERKNGHLLKKLREFFPGLSIETDFGWTGRLSCPIDQIPIIRTDNNVTYLITDGMPFGWLLGQMAADRISKGSSTYDSLYDHNRNYGFLENFIARSKLPRFLKEWGLKLGIIYESISSTLDEKFKN